MSDEVGQTVYERERSAFLGDQSFGLTPKDYSEDTAGKIDQEVRRLIDESYREAQALLKKNRKQLEEGGNMLLEKETITPEDFPALLQAA